MGGRQLSDAQFSLSHGAAPGHAQTWAATTNVAYSYDAAGYRTQMNDGVGSATYHYDAQGRMDWEECAFAGIGTYRLSYGYNPAGLKMGPCYFIRVGSTFEQAWAWCDLDARAGGRGVFIDDRPRGGGGGGSSTAPTSQEEPLPFNSCEEFIPYLVDRVMAYNRLDSSVRTKATALGLEMGNTAYFKYGKHINNKADGFKPLLTTAGRDTPGGEQAGGVYGHLLFGGGSTPGFMSPPKSGACRC